MGYLRTVVTYNQPSEAEVDKAFLESHGITVCLLNANTARNELGPAFYIQLQVPAEEYPNAVAILKEANPERFGSPERVAQIEAEMLRGVLRFAIPAVVFAVVGFALTPAPRNYVEMDLRMPVAISAGCLAGIASTMAMKWRNRDRR